MSLLWLASMEDLDTATEPVVQSPECWVRQYNKNTNRFTSKVHLLHSMRHADPPRPATGQRATLPGDTSTYTVTDYGLTACGLLFNAPRKVTTPDLAAYDSNVCNQCVTMVLCLEDEFVTVTL